MAKIGVNSADFWQVMGENHIVTPAPQKHPKSIKLGWSTPAPQSPIYRRGVVGVQEWGGENKEAYSLILSPVPNWHTSPTQRLKIAIKSLLRAHGLRCTALSPVKSLNAGDNVCKSAKPCKSPTLSRQALALLGFLGVVAVLAALTLGPVTAKSALSVQKRADSLSYSGGLVGTPANTLLTNGYTTRNPGISATSAASPWLAAAATDPGIGAFSATFRPPLHWGERSASRWEGIIAIGALGPILELESLKNPEESVIGSVCAGHSGTTTEPYFNVNPIGVIDNLS